ERPPRRATDRRGCRHGSGRTRSRAVRVRAILQTESVRRRYRSLRSTTGGAAVRESTRRTWCGTSLIVIRRRYRPLCNSTANSYLVTPIPFFDSGADSATHRRNHFPNRNHRPEPESLGIATLFSSTLSIADCEVGAAFSRGGGHRSSAPPRATYFFIPPRAPFASP